MKVTIAPLACKTCRSFKSFPNYSCKTCLYSFSSNYKQAREWDPKYIRRKQRKRLLDSSVPELRELYSRIKELYFDGNYVPHPDLVTFQWKRGTRGGGTCWKRIKKIKIGGLYRRVFLGQTIPDYLLAETPEIDLVKLMIHEAIHLRLAHHKKSFRMKEKEIKDKVKPEHMKELYDGLINSNKEDEAQLKPNVSM